MSAVPITPTQASIVARQLEWDIEFAKSYAESGKPVSSSTLAILAASVEAHRRMLLGFAGLNPDYTPTT